LEEKLFKLNIQIIPILCTPVRTSVSANVNSIGIPMKNPSSETGKWVNVMDQFGADAGNQPIPNHVGLFIFRDQGGEAIKITLRGERKKNYQSFTLEKGTNTLSISVGETLQTSGMQEFLTTHQLQNPSFGFDKVYLIDQMNVLRAHAFAVADTTPPINNWIQLGGGFKDDLYLDPCDTILIERNGSEIDMSL
jgi:hypothetical protein